MRLGMWLVNGVILGAVCVMAAIGGEEHVAKLVPEPQDHAGPVLTDLEAKAALAPSATNVASLATAYLDRDQPGLASAVIEGASPEIRLRPEVAVVQARALFHRGESRKALAVARAAAEGCADTCAPWLVAKSARQLAFLENVVAAGIDDPHDNPSAVREASDKSAHEVRLVAMR
jgi:hypothetical protein